MDEKDEREETSQRGRLDLSVPQVAGSALAAVTAALLASQLGVYGTIIGAGVVSIVATAGGTVFQHFFRRTGEQIRTVSTRHLPVSVPGTEPEAGAGSTRLLEELPPPGEDERPDGEYGEATVHGTTKRGWHKSAIGAVVVFVLAMGTVTSIELATGSEPSVKAVFDGGGTHHRPPADRPSAPASDPAGTSGDTPSPGSSTTPSESSSPSPTPSGSGSGSGSPTPDPSGSPSSSGSPSTSIPPTPDPGGSSDDGKGGTGGSASPGAQGGAQGAAAGAGTQN
ncbi:hypothetical protein [Streptomyces sp. RKAG293]|uniref:hypothetical protein n=1 Tax=Streptomyces sp. RKAG293 TaxID=2893403 RepID=UPI0020339B14|nr:hypothetical protein [Streptomyces sp. RKAG293]MCM2422099.1 hypothetical protein [Streptomyces sp. RKAG293]